MRLIDSYSELIVYTGYLLRSFSDQHIDYDVVRQKYLKLIDRSQQLSEDYGFSMKMWRDGFFPVCAWIDEQILCSQWQERLRWQKDQYQKKYFKTITAGRDFYHRLEQLPKDEKAVREVYEYCLAFGFRGTYYDPLDSRKIEEIQLTNLKTLMDTLDVEIPEELFPEVYEMIEFEKKKERFAWLGSPGFFVFLLLISLVVIFSTYFIYDYILSTRILSHFGVE